MTVKVHNEEMQYLETERCHGSTFYYCKVPTTGSCNISTPLRAAFLLQMSHDTSALFPSPSPPRVRNNVEFIAVLSITCTVCFGEIQCCLLQLDVFIFLDKNIFIGR